MPARQNPNIIASSDIWEGLSTGSECQWKRESYETFKRMSVYCAYLPTDASTMQLLMTENTLVEPSKPVPMQDRRT